MTYSDAMFFSLSGPLFYFFLLEILNERTITSASNAKHLWPVIPGLMFCATYNSLPHPLKVESFYGNNCGILPDDLLYAGEALGIIFYIILSINKVNKYLLHHRRNMSTGSVKQLHIYSWFLHFSFALSIGYGILTMATPHPIGIQMIIIFFLMIQSVSELLLVFSIKHVPVSFINETNQNILDNNSQGENDHHNIVNKLKLNAAAGKLENIMNEHKLYLNHDLDMDLLVKQTGLNSNQIKTSIREKYSMTVPEFINMYRIEHAKNLLSDTNSSIKIDILAHECGYSTRSNFYGSSLIVGEKR
jgi:AraC-like DNA-binding protein